MASRSLGLTFDVKLLWNTHHRNLMKKAHQLLGIYYPLINRNSKLSINNKLLIYTALIRPVLTYGCPTWSTLAPYRKAQLQTFQNKILRIIANAPWFVRNTTIHRDLNIISIIDFMLSLKDNYFQSASTHSNRTIANSHNYLFDPRLRYKRPKHS